MTILYRTDWLKHPYAIIDYQTKNKSFLRLATLYKEMGIRNCEFILALHNPALQGIDPHDPNLSEEVINLIAIECLDNFWYFVREVARAPGEAGDEAQPVEANRANIALWWSFMNHITFLLIQPRQTGKSFSTDVLMVWLMVIRCEMTKINLVTKDDKLRRANIDRMKKLMDELPRYFHLRDKSDAANTEEITINKNKNRYSTHVPQSSLKAAYNQGRGLTTNIVHFDEVPFQKYIRTSMGAMLASMGASMERAANAGAPYGVILTTTAGMKDTDEGKFIYDEFVAGGAPWSESFFDCNDEVELTAVVTQNAASGEPRINGTFDHRMLGKTDEWLSQKIRRSTQKGDDAARDYLNIWTSGNERSPFERSVAERIANSRMAPLYQQIFPERYVLRWYIPEAQIADYMATRKVVLGLDGSEGLGGGRDDLTIVMTDVITGETIAAGAFNETNLFMFSQWVANLLVRYKNITAIIEAKSSGVFIIDHLCALLPQYGEDPFKRLFNWIVNDQYESELARERFREIQGPLSRRDIQFHAERKIHMGYRTSGSGRAARDNLYSTALFLAAEKAGHKVKDMQLVQQIMSLVIKDGRLDHEDGKHDDMVVAWLLTHWFLTQAKNHSYYGIETSSILAELTVKPEETFEERLHRFEQMQIKDEIELLYARLVEEEDEYVAMRLESQLKLLHRKLDTENTEIYSLEHLLERVREAKKTKARAASLTSSYQPLYRTYEGASTQYTPPAQSYDFWQQPQNYYR